MKANGVPPTRRVLALVPSETWASLDDDQRVAVRFLDWHLRSRFEQKEHSPLELVDGDPCGVFLTRRHVQRFLRQARYRKTGIRFAAEVIESLIALGLLRDTDEGGVRIPVKRPRRASNRIASAAKFQKSGPVQSEGGRDAQPSLEHSYWWRVFKIIPLELVVRAYTRARGAYSSGETFKRPPSWTASLCAFARRQGLIPPARDRRSFRRGSVQWVFQNSGPP